MLATLKKLHYRAKEKRNIYTHYATLVNASRNPYVFSTCALPDTLDGRFESICLHFFLVKERIHRANSVDIPSSERLLQEAFIDDMDRTLREMGIGDMGVSKRVKKMVSALYGRMKAYEDTVEDETAFKDALTRNAYRGKAPSETALVALVDYVQKQRSHLATYPDAALADASMVFAPV